MPTDAQKRATKKYHDKQVGITIRVKPEEKKYIEQKADELDESVKTFLLKSAKERMERLENKKNPQD